MYREEAIALVSSELDLAQETFPPFNSPHEGYAVLKEEVDELWNAVKALPSGTAKVEPGQEIEYEAKQVAAMALRFLIDLC
jgi:hypothetical protein